MSKFKDTLDEQTPNTFRDKVLREAKGELSAIRKKQGTRQFWQLAFGSALSLAGVSWFFRRVQPENGTDLLAMQDEEMLQDLDVIDELELMDEIEKAGIEI